MTMNRSLSCFFAVIVKLPTIPNSVVDSGERRCLKVCSYQNHFLRCLALFGEKSF